MIEFDVKIEAGDLYNFMLVHAYNTLVGLIGNCFGALMLVIFAMDPGQWIFLACGVILLVYQPISLKMKSKQLMLTTPAFQKPLHYVLDEEGLSVSQGEATESLSWENMYKATATGRSVILYTNKVVASVFPNRELGDKRAKVVEMISTHMPPNKVKIRGVEWNENSPGILNKGNDMTEAENIRVWETYGPEETFHIGQQLGQAAEAGCVYTLIGDLGVGKTVLTQGVAAGLGITGPVNSPTFTIMQIYDEGRLPFYHFDVYRIADAEEMEEVGYEEYFYGDGVCLIEWADLIEEILPRHYYRITIKKDLEKGFDYRNIEMKEVKYS